MVRLTWYVTDREEYLGIPAREIGAAYREVMGRISLRWRLSRSVALVEAQARVEIEATAVVPRGLIRDRFAIVPKGVLLTRRRTQLLLAATATATLALHGAAQAATKTVYMGAPPADAKKFNAVHTDTMDFFPSKIVIAAGDWVSFVVVGFHNVDFPPKGGKILEQLVQTTPVTAANDAAGAPFWYSGIGLKNYAFAPALQDQSAGLGQHLTYTGAKRVISHIPLNTAHPFAPFKPMVVKFPKPGTYTYYDDLHPGQKGTVTVLKKGAKAPTAAQDKKAIAKQVASELGFARTLTNIALPSNTMYLGVAGDKGKVEYINFFPGLPHGADRHDRHVRDEPRLSSRRTRRRQARATT